MRLIILFLCIGFVHVSAATSAQTVTMQGNKMKLSEVFTQIRKQTGYAISGNADLLKDTKPVDIAAEQMPLDTFLQYVLKNQPLEYKKEGKNIFLFKKKEPVTSIKPLENILQDEIIPLVRGKVVDTLKRPIGGVTVRAFTQSNTPTKFIGITMPDGTFSISNVPANTYLMFSYVGYYPFRQSPKADLGIVILRQVNTNLQEVMVNSGFVTRRAESFTGSAVTFSQQELLRAGNQNLLQSLKNLDPSFQLIENVDMGSNPNAMPDIQIRGKNSLPNLQGDFSGNPNQPLFILDGFETTIQRVFDLNMNRVASITLLKDAAAKAIYGSRAANGVVIVETIKPKAGELRISYSGDLGVEAPDLSGYNLMNAEEKLAFEKERGMYYRYVNGSATAQQMDNIYKQNYDNVTKGVNTYWLSQPLRTGISYKHALNLEGGDEHIRYQGGVTYNQLTGVMKGSDRQTLGINNTLSYSYRNLIFRNSLEYNRNVSTNSPYGQFSDYVKLNQYYQPYDENGNAVRVLGLNALGNVYNPLYNATLNTKSTTNYTEFINNFNIDWRISNSLRAVGSLAYSRNVNTSDLFYPASHTMFYNYDDRGLSDRKGQYTKGDGVNQFVNSNLGLNYNKTLGKHLFFGNATLNINERTNAATTVVAEGFGNDRMDNISFASQYLFNGKPTGFDNKVREIGIVGIANYSYADRYLFDASIRTSGSSMYGSENRWGAFWALGAGWNLHKEGFMKAIPKLSQLRLRSSVGYTGSQNFNPYQARTRYTYGDIVYNGRLGAELMGLPNSSLKWQRTMDYNIGADVAYAGFLTGRFDYYQSNTTGLLSDITVVPSMGFDSYKENFGETQNRGYEFSVGITPWRNTSKKGWFTFNVSALHNKNKLTKIYNTFDSWNNRQNAEKEQIPTADTRNTQALKDAYTKPSTYFYEGQSMDAIWGVRSLGIDPVTGQEMYLDRNGNSTFVWSAADQVAIGNTQPKMRGNIGFNAGYQGFTLSVICSYKFGGDIYNSTLIERVENVTGYDNLDRRILDSWRKPGDISPYRALNITSGGTPVYTMPTSRLVQRESELYISSLNVGYDFTDKKWMRNMHLSRLRCTFYMNELLRISTINIERGTSYPFARNFSFMLQANF